jgi:uncharacterized protein
MNHYQKYLKYKAKYLKLKTIQSKMTFTKLVGGYKNFTDALEEIYKTFGDEDDTKSISHSVDLLEGVLEEKNVSPCHGIEHARVVMYHAYNALEDYDISQEDKLAVLLASLLHDADDRKFFPDHHDYENLRKILTDNGKTPDFIEKVVYMVSIVSASKNGDKIPPQVVGKEWMLIPRYADRLEAIGLIGIERCLTYTVNVSKMPLYIASTPRPKTEEEIWAQATASRYAKYDGNSQSMIDHYYDKLLRLSVFPIRNKYFDSECEIRRRPLIKFILWFGEKGNITKEDVDKFVEENKVHASHSDE